MSKADKVQKIRNEVERLQNELIQEREKGYGSDVDDACILELQNVLTYIDSLQEEPVNEELEEASKNYALNNTPWDDCINEIQESFKAGAKWWRENLWKPTDGDDLPEIDREVIALLDNGKIVFAHRPSEYCDGKDIITGKVIRYYPKTYDNGGWNIPNVKYWLDVKLPKEIEL